MQSRLWVITTCVRLLQKAETLNYTDGKQGLVISYLLLPQGGEPVKILKALENPGHRRGNLPDKGQVVSPPNPDHGIAAGAANVAAANGEGLHS